MVESQRVHLLSAAVEAMRILGRKVCTCCEHTEHVTDKTGAYWVQFSILRDDVEYVGHQCRRCGEGCQNLRCDELPANPDGRGYGLYRRFGR